MTFVNPLKGYTTTILFWASGLLLIALIVVTFYYRAKNATLKADNAQVTANFTIAKAQNEDDAKKIKALAQQISDLTEQRRVQALAAGQAAARIEAMGRQYDEQATQNRLLRDKLSRENPNVKKYLTDGLPVDLVCSMWPKACTNKDRSGGGKGTDVRSPGPSADDSRAKTR